MKTIKSALLGQKTISETGERDLQNRLREILSSHRALIINGLLRDLPTYVDYKFNCRLDKHAYERLKHQLLELKNYPVDLDRYSSVVNQVARQSLVHLTNEPFFKEIDTFVASNLGINK